MSSTRDHVLKTLLINQRCTIKELAETVGINPISVRHHVTKLEASGLVNSEEERHGVGRPRRVYFLTENGMEKFPTSYLRLTTRLLKQLKASMPEQLVSELFMQVAKEMADDYTGNIDLKNLTIEERLDIVKEMLSYEGFTVEWDLRGEHYQIRGANCPYYHVGQTHPEVCTVDQALISSVLSVPAIKVKCILKGDKQCIYIIPNEAIMEMEVAK